MGRKKKSAQKLKDARGYSRGGGPLPSQQQQQQTMKDRRSPASTTSACEHPSKAPSVSTRAHGEMKNLLGRFDDRTISERETSSSSSVPVPPSDRFATRLANVVDRLDELGFSPGNVDSAVEALRYDITLETALDWLCLNLDALELPALFADGDLRRDMSRVTTAQSLVVLRESSAGATAAKDDSQSENILVVDRIALASDGDNGLRKNGGESERQKEKEQKQWLLRQYEYEGESDDVASPESAMKEEAVVQPLTPDEQRLSEEERALAELEADLGNDANNYMRSKGEIKQLQGQVKRARQKVAGLRKKVERSREQRERQRQEEMMGKDKEEKEEEEAAEDYGGGFLSMFANGEEGEQNEPSTAAEEKSPAESSKIYDFTIPSGWTGSTPQKKLFEALKKRNLPRAKYSKLPMNGGFVLSVTVDKSQPSQKWEARAADYRKESSLKDYLATHALYAIDPDVPLYQIFPPPFRELWLSWAKQEKGERDHAQKLRDDARQERMDHLMSLIANAQKLDRPDGASAKDDLQDGQRNSDENQDLSIGAAVDNWDDEVEDDLPTRTDNMAPSAKGKKMQVEFCQRQSTPSYKKMKATRDNLPMTSFRSTVLETVENNPVTILCAETGAGKSTQCPQYILEQALLDGRGDSVNVVCTQPRRVAATSLAERVSEEMRDELGGSVGYQIRMESRRSARTRLLFCTTGVILRRLQDDPALTGVTHVVCDEVHERAQQVDVLLIVLRRLLRTTRPDLKVILMSATMETELFRSFFQGAPMINVPGRTFPVMSYHLEDLLDATDHIIEESSRYAFRENRHGDTASLWVTTRGGERRKETVDLTSQVEPGEVSDAYAGYKMSTRRSMERVNEEVINFDLVEDVLKLITNQNCGHALVAPDGADMTKGSILIFLPGLGEIRALIERLEGNRIFRDRHRFDLIPLHSTLSSRDQRRAFLPPKPGCRKIICSTNIAETSVTIPDCVCVIDTGRVREVRRNKRTSASMLVTDWCPQSSAKQRQGRAGRVQPGVCLKLYSLATAESIMKATNEPELRRVPLEEICMSILASGFAKSCMDFLNQAPQPPPKESVQAAVDVLYDVGAIGRIGADDAEKSEYLTPLGIHLSKLPVDVKLGKILIFGALFQCIDPILTVAASLSSKSPFSAFIGDAAVAKAKQRIFTDSDSDFMTYCNVWDAYEAAGSASRRFCQENFLNHAALREIGDARRQFLDLLCGIGFLDRNTVIGNGSRVAQKTLKSCRFNQHAKRMEVVHAVICAGLYPNILRLEQSSSTNYSMWHKNERIYFHKASVNATKKNFSSTENWVVFHEKFGTPNRTSVSTTAFVHPFALLLFGGTVLVKHTERTVIVDNWMNIGMSAQTGVMLREVRKRVDLFLQRIIKCVDSNEIGQLDSSMIGGIIKILES